LLLFNFREIRRHFSAFQIGIVTKLLILHIVQKITFNRAQGVIYLTEYGKKQIGHYLKKSPNSVVVAHGVNAQFQLPAKTQFEITHYTQENPFVIIYTSQIALYKHQVPVMQAVSLLKNKGYPLKLLIVGEPYTGTKIFNETRKRIDPQERFIGYLNHASQNQLVQLYQKADLFVFASSCESFGITLLEAMSASLPITCSNRSVLPEILGDAGVYFDPENPSDIATTIEKLINSPKLRTNLAKKAREKAMQYSWQKCAYETFSFISKVYNEWHKQK